MNLEMIILHGRTTTQLAEERIALPIIPTYIGHDIHSFLLVIKHPKHLIHLQGYSGLSTPDLAIVNIRLMDTKKWQALYDDPRISIGNEHDALVTERPINTQFEIPNYDPQTLAEIIKTQLVLRYSPIQ